jgi:uncharacterized protein
MLDTGRRPSTPPEGSYGMGTITRRKLLIAALIAIAGMAGSLALAQPRSLTMGGGFTGGTFNVFVGGIQDVLAANLPALVGVRQVPSAGSIQNLQQILAGRLDMALAFAGDAYFAFNGFDLFDDDESPVAGVRAIGYLYPAVSQIVALAGSGITNVRDLAGKRVAVGEFGSGTHMSIDRLLNHLGIAGDVTFVYVAGQLASEMLKDGRVDAYHALLGVPNATVNHTAADRDVVVLTTLDAALVSGFFDRYPFYLPVVIPAGAYRGVDSDVLTWKDSALWVVSDALDDELVYQMTKAVYGETGVSFMRIATPVAREMGAQTALRGVALPLHPGAARYWLEVGLELPAIAKP